MNKDPLEEDAQYLKARGYVRASVLCKKKLPKFIGGGTLNNKLPHLKYTALHRLARNEVHVCLSSTA